MTATHGGDLVGIGRAFGCDPASLLDFSANVNPLGPPAAISALLRSAAEQPAILGAYPDPQARELIEALAARDGVLPGRVAVANGNAALLDVVVRALAPRRCILPVPAFSEYARALASAGTEIIPLQLHAYEGFALDRERLVALARATGADACIVANPHNPSGRGEPAAEIAALIAELAAFACTTVVDEAFVDYAPDLGVLACAPVPAVVLRSLTKFFAIPGLRVGYGFAPEPLADRIRSLQPSWPVGTLEQRAAIAVLADAAFTRTTLGRNAVARIAFVRDLRALGCRVFPPAANFVFCDVRALDADTPRLRDRLIREHGIVIRTFETEPALAGGAFVRLAVRDPGDNARLIAALTRRLPR
jgi:threonine-phosphate decarboxylase